MHDIRAIRDNPTAFDAALARRGVSAVSASLLEIDSRRRAAILAAETAQAEQNKASKYVGAAKASGDEAEFERLRALVAAKKAEVAAMNAKAKEIDSELEAQLMGIENLALDDVPEGEDEAGNVEVHRWGSPRQINSAREHFDLPGVAAGMDFETAAKLSGSRFVLLRGAVARLHRALAQFMLDVHIDEHGLSEVNTPVLVRDAAMRVTGQLPKFEEDLFKISMFGKREVPIINLDSKLLPSMNNLSIILSSSERNNNLDPIILRYFCLVPFGLFYQSFV